MSYLEAEDTSSSHKKLIQENGSFNCEFCLEQGMALSRRCETYPESYILARNLRAIEIAKKNLYDKIEIYKERKKIANKGRNTKILDMDTGQLSEDNEEDEEKKYPIIFDKDGYQHRYCPVTEASFEIQTIISDTLYCIETHSMPDPGGAFDQSELFRKAFMVINNEREKIKNEHEKATLNKGGKGKGNVAPPRSSLGQRRGR